MIPKVKIVEVFEELSPLDSGSWTAPEGCYEVEFALVAGGFNGEYSDIYNAGNGGNGGQVINASKIVKPGTSYYAGSGGRGGYGVKGDVNDPSVGSPGKDGSYVFNNKYPDRYPYPMGAGGGSGAYTRGWDIGFFIWR